jgi:predicted transcriptional regulator of viral defense system
MPNDKRQQILHMVREAGVLRPRDAEAQGIAGEYLNRLHAAGLLDRPSRGLYVLPNSEPSEHRTIAEACKRVPHGVICLLSALRYHNLTTQSPFEVWMAIDDKARLPKIDYPPLRFSRFSGQALAFGVQEARLEKVRVRVYSPAKTVADCFKFRNKVGLDVALEALRDCWKQKNATMDELWAAAKVCRMTNVMRPYMEALT